jgi:hypothetical protein
MPSYESIWQPIGEVDLDGESITLHEKVGQILRVMPIGDIRRILLSLLFFASDFPTPMMRNGAVPPDRRQYSMWNTPPTLW